MTSQWLIDSFSNKKFLPTDNYKVPFFKGLKVRILGFRADEIEEIKTLITRYEGECTASLDSKDTNLFLVRLSELKTYESYLSSYGNIPAVSVDWLKACLLSEQYVKPLRFAVNTPKPTTRQSAQQRANESLQLLTQVEGHLNKVMNQHEIDEDKWNYLEKTRIYFHCVHPKIEKILKKLVAAGGGFYLNELLPGVTHVIAEEYIETDSRYFNQYTEVKVVSVLWLRDCLIYQRKIKEDDYLLQPIPASESTENSRSLSRRNTIGYSSFGSQDELSNTLLAFRTPTNSQGLLLRKTSMPPMTAATFNFEKIEKENSEKSKSRKSETKDKNEGGHTNSGRSKSKAKKANTPTITIKGYVFKNVNCYLDEHLNNLSHYKKLVLENSGKILDNLNIFEEIFWILPDSQKSVQILQKHKGRNIKFVSYRWLEYCIKNKILVREIGRADV